MADTRESLRKKREAYLATFCGDGEAPHPMGEAVLSDLRRFVGLDHATQKPGIVTARSGMVDSHATVYLAGKRDVYLRLLGFLNLDEKYLLQENTHDDSTRESTTPSADR